MAQRGSIASRPTGYLTGATAQAKFSPFTRSSPSVQGCNRPLVGVTHMRRTRTNTLYGTAGVYASQFVSSGQVD